MLSDLLDISDTLTRVYRSYSALELLIGSSSGIVLDGNQLASLLGSVNEQLETVINNIDDARKANLESSIN